MVETVVVASNSAESASVIARRLAVEGVNIAVVVASGTHALGTLAGELVTLGAANVLAIPCDVASMNDVVAAAARIEAELGPIDRWVNASMTDYGFVCGTRAALDRMRARDHGTIVQVSAPASVRMFTQGLRGELRLDGSHIVLETVRTQPFRRVGAAALAAATVVGAALLRRMIRR